MCRPLEVTLYFLEMKKIINLITSVLLCATVFGQINDVSLKSTEEFAIASKAVNDTFYIQISLPNNYYNADNQYPIIYLLDSDPSFGMVKGITWWLNFGQLIPEVIIVGIAYKKGWWQKRSRDYTPTEDKAKNWGDWPLAGGADNFIDFLSDELNPKLREYRIDWSDKTIIGVSFGGLLITYTLLTRPELFDNYISISPALIWNNNYLLTLSLDNLQNKKSESFVFTAVGELDEEKITEPWKSFNLYIREKDFENLVWNSVMYENQTHVSVFPIAISDGLRTLFKE